MNKKQGALVIFLALVISLAGNVVFGRFLAAKFSTWPLLNRLKIMSPEAPIVINTREQVRISDGGDVLNAIASAKSKLSVVASESAGQLTVTGGAVNLTSDGIFATAESAFSQTGTKYYVVLSDGTTAAITETTIDSVTGLVFFKAAASGVPVADLGTSKALGSGEKILFLQNSLQSFQTKYLSSFVTASQTDVEGQVLDSDRPARTFGAQAAAPLAPGQAAVNLTGAVVGIWNGSGIVSSDVLKNSLSLYLSGQKQILRPGFGFSYTLISKAEAAILSVPEGARVALSPKAASPAAKAGLLEKDIITAADGNRVSESQPLEELLQKYKPGDRVTLEVFRGKQKINLTITAGELK